MVAPSIIMSGVLRTLSAGELSVDDSVEKEVSVRGEGVSGDRDGARSLGALGCTGETVTRVAVGPSSGTMPTACACCGTKPTESAEGSRTTLRMTRDCNRGDFCVADTRLLGGRWRLTSRVDALPLPLLDGPTRCTGSWAALLWGDMGSMSEL